MYVVFDKNYYIPVCACVCTHVYACFCTNVCMSISLRHYTRMRSHPYVPMCVCVPMCAPACMRVRPYVCLCACVCAIIFPCYASMCVCYIPVCAYTPVCGDPISEHPIFTPFLPQFVHFIGFFVHFIEESVKILILSFLFFYL